MKNKAAQELGKLGGLSTAKKHPEKGKKWAKEWGKKAAKIRWDIGTSYLLILQTGH